MRTHTTLLAVLLSLALAPAARAGVTLAVGYGFGFFASGGPGIGDANTHLQASLAVDLSKDRFRLRLLTGSLERVDLPIEGDNDADYASLAILATRRWTGWPIDVGAGIGYYRQALPEGYPDRLGRRVYEYRWGPNLTAAREWPLTRHLLGWGEVDAHYVPYRRAETFVVADAGLAVRF